MSKIEDMIDNLTDLLGQDLAAAAKAPAGDNSRLSALMKLTAALVDLAKNERSAADFLKKAVGQLSDEEVQQELERISSRGNV